MYLIPSLNTVVLRQGDSSDYRYNDHTFLKLLLGSEQEAPSPSATAPPQAGSPSSASADDTQ